MIRVGITGKSGFIGYHLYQSLNLFKEEFTLVEFEKSFFNEQLKLDAFVSSCDVIIHLAALNRHNEPEVIYETNVSLVNNLVEALERTKSQAHVIISSSTQEERENLYGKSKKEGRKIFSDWANRQNGRLSGLIIPNVFGPFGQPYYNSVVATFCHQIANGETPKIDVDGDLKLIYVGELVDKIIQIIRDNDNTHQLFVPHTAEAKVSEILVKLKYFQNSYQETGEIPALNNDFEFKLFNTYRCYMNIASYFPKKLIQHLDARGGFVEIARQGIPGQTSFSTTLPEVTRGNHYHTRKIERFAVIKGKALIQLRRIGTEDIHEFYLDGDYPAYVDMPIWYTHNIKNIGDDTLYTIFWINEPFDPNNPDTYFEIV
jgi:UDP-2-acetamido-2,6-beta-L-arabino-hexul-4-ose reductase